MSRFCVLVNGPQNGWSPGNSRADASMASATIASTRPVSISCQRRRPSGSSPASLATRVVIAARSPRTSLKMRGAPPASRASPSVSSSSSPGNPNEVVAGGIRKVEGSSLARSSQSATAVRAARQAASAFAAPIRAASDSRVSRSSIATIAAAAERSLDAIAVASRASLLIRLISVSQSRAAASSSSGVVAAATAARNPPCAVSFAAWTARGSDLAAAAWAAASWPSYVRWARRRASSAASAWVRARVASSQRSSARRRSSAQRSVAPGVDLADDAGRSARATAVRPPVVSRAVSVVAAVVVVHGPRRRERQVSGRVRDRRLGRGADRGEHRVGPGRDRDADQVAAGPGVADLGRARQRERRRHRRAGHGCRGSAADRERAAGGTGRRPWPDW